METEGALDAFEAGGVLKHGEKLTDIGFPVLSEEDVSQAVTFLLMTPYTVNITELVIKPTGEVV